MLNFTLALLLSGTASPGAAPPAKAKWIDIARSGDASLLQLDASTHQRSGVQNAVWLRLISPVPDARGVKTATSLVWLNCKDRTYNLMIHREDDARGNPVNQRVYGARGRGFEEVKPGTAVATVQSAVCR